MRKRHIMVTGIVGWLGGLATAVIGTSCDVEAECAQTDRAAALIKVVDSTERHHSPVSADAVRFAVLGEDGPDEFRDARCLDSRCSEWTTDVHEPGLYQIEVEACGETYTEEMEIAADGSCHMVQALTTVVADACRQSRSQDDGLDLHDAPPKCDTVHHPSVYVQVLAPDGAMMHVANVDRVWFEHDGNRMDALCVENPVTGGCQAWIAGQELTGDFTVFTEYCDAMVEEQVTVRPTDDGCHPDTEFLMIQADTRKCLINHVSKGDPPPPGPVPR